MNLKFYAVMKDYFGAEMQLDKSIISIQDLKEQLAVLKPEARTIINSSRFAVGTDFVDDFFLLSDNIEIHIIPPSSGG